jgi:hypothetical protein
MEKTGSKSAKYYTLANLKAADNYLKKMISKKWKLNTTVKKPANCSLSEHLKNEQKRQLVI